MCAKRIEMRRGVEQARRRAAIETPLSCRSGRGVGGEGYLAAAGQRCAGDRPRLKPRADKESLSEAKWSIMNHATSVDPAPRGRPEARFPDGQCGRAAIFPSSRLRRPGLKSEARLRKSAEAHWNQGWLDRFAHGGRLTIPAPRTNCNASVLCSCSPTRLPSARLNSRLTSHVSRPGA